MLRVPTSKATSFLRFFAFAVGFSEWKFHLRAPERAQRPTPYLGGFDNYGEQLTAGWENM